MQQAFDPTSYLIERADQDRTKLGDLQDGHHDHEQRISSLENRTGSLEQWRERFSLAVRLLLPLSVLILAGLAALGPKIAVDLALAAIKIAL